MVNTKTYYDTLASVASAADSDIIVIQTNESSDLSTMKKTTVGALRQKTIDMIASNAHASSNAGSYVFGIEQNETGRVDANLKGFDIVIDNSSSDNNAPTSRAVKTYVQTVRDIDIASDIRDTIESLDVSAVGGEGKYIKKISEVDGKIIPVEETLENDVTRSTNKAPTTSAVKTYVDSKIGSLNLNTVGGSGKLIQSITQTDGVVTATTISLDQNLSSSASKVPTSEAVFKTIGNLTGAVGNGNTLVKNISETSGVISGETIALTGVVSNDANAVPTSQAVYNKVTQSFIDVLKDLNSNAGQNGAYIKTVKQDNGQVTATTKKFDTYDDYNGGATPGVWKNNGVIIPSPSDDNTLSTKAAKGYTDWNAAVITKRIDDTNFSELGQDGYFIQKVSQSSGAISAEIKEFENNAIASFANSSNASYSSRVDTAPTVKAVADQIKRLDDRVTVANSDIAGLNYTGVYEPGKFVGSVSENTGIIEIYKYNFASSIAASTTEASNAVAPTEHAVRQAINALDVDQIGATGSYIRFVVEKDGKISATPVEFDHFASNAEAASWANKTNENSPSTLAVYNFVNRVKEDILEKTKSMTYEGTVGSFNDLVGKAPFDKGDTFIASASFNLESSSGVQIQYNVNKGDMLICKDDSATYDKDNFDIIGGNEFQIIFQGAGSTENNIPVFADTRGVVLKDSGENIQTVASKASAAACSASAASLAASYAASSADFAEIKATAYIEEISSDASYAASCASYAKDSSNAASSAASYAQGSSDAAVAALEATTGSQEAAFYSASYAASSATVALSAAGQAQDSFTAANNAASRAQGSSDAAVAALEATTGSQEAAFYSASYAASSATVANIMAGNAESSAQGAEDFRILAFNSLNNTTGYEDSARLSAIKAASFASDANLEDIKNSASLSAYYASSSASLASSTVSNKVDKTTTGTQTIRSNLQVGTAGGVTISTNGTVSGTAFEATSSRKVKENIKPSLISALDVIDKVDIVDFNYIYDDEKTPHIGFIAEDTSELLSTPHKNKMDYTNCIGTLLKAVQEITKGMEELKKEVDSLK